MSDDYRKDNPSLLTGYLLPLNIALYWTQDMVQRERERERDRQLNCKEMTLKTALIGAANSPLLSSQTLISSKD